MRDRWDVSASIPRHAFSLRDAARAGDLWRCFQEVVVDASSQAGWPPERYRDERCAVIVRTMTVNHHRETHYGEPLRGETWVRRCRREMLMTREVRIRGKAGPVASATQEWVFVSDALKPSRAGEAFLSAFPLRSEANDVRMPRVEGECEGAPWGFAFEVWYGWMDPLDHANHPAYIDWCDEAISRRMVAAGLKPIDLVPVAETATYSRGVIAGEGVEVRSRRLGRTEDGSVVFEHQICVGDVVCAKAKTVRRIAGEDQRAFVAAFD